MEDRAGHMCGKSAARIINLTLIIWICCGQLVCVFNVGIQTWSICIIIITVGYLDILSMNENPLNIIYFCLKNNWIIFNRELTRSAETRQLSLKKKIEAQSIELSESGIPGQIRVVLTRWNSILCLTSHVQLVSLRERADWHKYLPPPSLPLL